MIRRLVFVEFTDHVIIIGFVFLSCPLDVPYFFICSCVSLFHYVRDANYRAKNKIKCLMRGSLVEYVQRDVDKALQDHSVTFVLMRYMVL